MGVGRRLRKSPTLTTVPAPRSTDDGTPSWWELLRGQLRELTTEVRGLRASIDGLDDRYHRRELLDSRHGDHDRRIGELEGAKRSRRAALWAAALGEAFALSGAYLLILLQHH